MEAQYWRQVCDELQGREVLVWTRGGHFFRGFMGGYDERGLVIVEKVSVTLVTDRGEREKAMIPYEAIDAIA